MVDEANPDHGYPIGYGKPPQSGQFTKGKSGNPAGRKRSKAVPPPPQPQYLPTQKAIRKGGERMLQVREGGELTQIPAREAVMQALLQKALQGSVFAQRECIKQQLEEDLRRAAEQEEIYQSWRDYHARMKPLFDKARRDGEPEPDQLPHPDDIKFDCADRGVRIIGPLDTEERAAVLRTRRAALLMLELIQFYQEDNYLDADDMARSRMGLWMANYLLLLDSLPPRFREIAPEEERVILCRAVGPRKAWIDYLRGACTEFGLPLFTKQGKWRTLSLRELGWQFEDGQI